MERVQKKYRGVIIPAVTPLTRGLSLDEGAVERLFENFYNHGAAPFILGTTGESSSLSQLLRKKYIRKAAAIKKEGSFLYAGIGSNCVRESVDLARYAFDQGVDAVAATLPSYYGLTESQMRDYFLGLAEEIKGPLIIYNIPATTHMSIPIGLIDELSNHPLIVGVKDSERSEERLSQSISLWKNRTDFSHFLGWAARSAHALLEGGDGLIPSTGNLLPGIYSEMEKAVETGDREKAFLLQDESDWYGNLYQGGRTLGQSLWALKVLLQEEKLCKPVVMPPLQPGTASEAKKLIEQWKQKKSK